MPRVRHPLLVLTLLLVHAPRVGAAGHPQPTRLFLVKDVAPGSDVQHRRITFTGVELKRSDIDIVGDPTVDGATLHVRLADGDEECLSLPASGWFRTGSVGFRYTNGASPGAAGIVVIKKESLSGDFLLKMKFSGAGDPITVVPMQSVTSFAATFTIGGGDQYCAGGATPAGSIVTDRIYRVKQVGAPVACDLAACSPGGAFLD